MKEVIIYTAEGCGHCHDAKEFLKDNNIPFVEHIISKDKDARKELSELPPLIEVDGFLVNISNETSLPKL